MYFAFTKHRSSCDAQGFFAGQRSVRQFFTFSHPDIR